MPEPTQTSPEQTLDRHAPLRRWARLALGTVLGIVLLVLALRGVRLTDVWATLQQADLVYITLALILSTGVNVAKAIRWQIILRPYAPGLNLRRLFAVLMIGQSLNTFAPLRVGDVARGYLVEGVSVATVLYSVVVEKALDSLTLIVLLVAVGAAIPVPPWLKQSGILLSVVLVAMLLVMIVAGRGSVRLTGVGMWLESVLPPLRRLGVARRIGAAASALRALSQARVLVDVAAWTAVSWVLGIAANVVAFLAMAVAVGTPILAGTFLILVLYLGAIVPSSPGKVGVFHYLVVISLALFGVERTPALAYAIVLHLISYGPPAVLGAYYIWRESQRRG